MYKGLDIITNKVTAEEQAQCPHHLLSILSPLSMNNTVVDFRNMALPIVSSCLSYQQNIILKPQLTCHSTPPTLHFYFIVIDSFDFEL